MTSPTPTCQGCRTAEPTCCDECRRALALKSFSGISRHPESGTGCLVCEDGPPSWCGNCLVAAVSTYRDSLREHSGHDIGRWPDYPDQRAALRHSDEITRILAARPDQP